MCCFFAPLRSKLSVSLPSDDVLRSIRWELMADGRTGQALVVCEVLEGSDAEQVSPLRKRSRKVKCLGQHQGHACVAKCNKAAVKMQQNALNAY